MKALIAILAIIALCSVGLSCGDRPSEIVIDLDALRIPCEQVSDFSKVPELVDEMKATLEMHGGMGLSANQIGRQEAVCIIKLGDESVITLVNPVITQREGSQRCVEQCISRPGTFVAVTRPREIHVKAFDEYGNSVQYHFTDLEASVACHEIDHLDGRLIVDYQ